MQRGREGGMRDLRVGKSQPLGAVHRGDGVSQLRSAEDNAFPRHSNIGSYSHPALNLIVPCSPRVRISITFAVRRTELGQRRAEVKIQRDLAGTIYIYFFFKIIDPSENERS